MLSPHAEAFLVRNLVLPPDKADRTLKTEQYDNSVNHTVRCVKRRGEDASKAADWFFCACHDAKYTSLCRHPSVVTATDEHHVHGVSVELCQADLWQAFHRLRTEMIITKCGRRMFPALRVTIRGLNPTALYRLTLEFVQCGVNKYRYVYQHSKWMVAGAGEDERGAEGARRYRHTDCPVAGSTLMAQPVSLEKVKLTNAANPSPCQVLLNSMQMFQPVVHIQRERTEEDDAGEPPLHRRMTFVFPQTSFMAVTAYQNQEITRLKIARNPFAKGFREACINKHYFPLADGDRRLVAMTTNNSFAPQCFHPTRYLPTQDWCPPKKIARRATPASAPFLEVGSLPEMPSSRPCDWRFRHAALPPLPDTSGGGTPLTPLPAFSRTPFPGVGSLPTMSSSGPRGWPRHSLLPPRRALSGGLLTPLCGPGPRDMPLPPFLSPRGTPLPPFPASSDTQLLPFPASCGTPFPPSRGFYGKEMEPTPLADGPAFFGHATVDPSPPYTLYHDLDPSSSIGHSSPAIGHGLELSRAIGNGRDPCLTTGHGGDLSPATRQKCLYPSTVNSHGLDPSLKSHDLEPSLATCSGRDLLPATGHGAVRPFESGDAALDLSFRESHSSHRGFQSRLGEGVKDSSVLSSHQPRSQLPEALQPNQVRPSSVRNGVTAVSLRVPQPVGHPAETRPSSEGNRAAVPSPSISYHRACQATSQHNETQLYSEINFERAISLSTSYQRVCQSDLLSNEKRPSSEGNLETDISFSTSHQRVCQPTLLSNEKRPSSEGNHETNISFSTSYQRVCQPALLFNEKRPSSDINLETAISPSTSHSRTCQPTLPPSCCLGSDPSPPHSSASHKNGMHHTHDDIVSSVLQRLDCDKWALSIPKRKLCFS